MKRRLDELSDPGVNIDSDLLALSVFVWLLNCFWPLFEVQSFAKQNAFNLLLIKCECVTSIDGISSAEFMRVILFRIIVSL